MATLKYVHRVVLATILVFLSLSANAQVSWSVWIDQLRSEAIADGIRSDVFDNAFAGMQAPKQSILNLDRKQPEKRLTFLQYRKTRIDPYRIELGERNYRQNEALLNQVGRDFNVDPCFVVAFWGIESSYGKYMGNFPVIHSLATLAYDERRGDKFRKEVILALHILQDGHVSADQFKGEWAGASGQSQFLPSSWKRYAVDYDGDGRQDIWTSKADVFASIANYMAMNGWQAGQPWAMPVLLPSNMSDDMVGLKVQHTVAEWEQMGVHLSASVADTQLMASIIKPLGGPDFIVFNNFRTIMKYNNSIYYAASVGYLADRICGR